ncbi:unnamed protein product [Rotaria sp. Silwood1]|nr:unnamed protein product [Rotaria sp. Silwood1]CAF1571205.1 unnamed protein product [Rotaria sp. Silwood1]CAF3694954.1 unnamed protein product [Rotaria sp. Silwood1]CAF3755628.1 unnamed protein product [Rotaria sp. Silwood1]CAF4786883.1 unnamed protein product [Rotaria sp. Silwood1]
MFVVFGVFYLALTFFPHESIQQEPLPYTLGYRSSFKFHQNCTINLLISAPHGGNVTPSDVPNRTQGCLRMSGPNAGNCTWFYNDTCVDGTRCNATTVKDAQSDEFAENVANELNRTWGYKPSVIIAKWSRKKVDFNREINEATFNHPEAIAAYQGYHSFIDQSINQINATFGRGLLIDIHGHGDGNYTMVGYLLTGAQLNRDNLNTLSVTTSIEPLCGSNRNECIRGNSSFGTALERNGLDVVYPSLANPKPGSIDFLSGGYITSNYISRINAIQTELPNWMRTANNRLDNARKYAQAIVDYMQTNHLLRSSSTR